MEKYQAFTLNNYRQIPQVAEYLSKEAIFDIEVVGNVLPFKANNYVVNELIDWGNYKTDPIYIPHLPAKGNAEAAALPRNGRSAAQWRYQAGNQTHCQ